MAPGDPPSVYDELMRFQPEGLSPNGWAVRAGVSRTVWSDIRRHNNPSRRTLEKLLVAAGSSLAEYEALRIGDARMVPGVSGKLGEHRGGGWRAAPIDPLPVFVTEAAGEWGGAGSGIEQWSVDPSRAIDRLDRPVSLAADRDAYAVTVLGDAMAPRFRPGRRVIVSPAAPVAIGDDVLVRLAGKEGLVLVKQLTGRSAARIDLRQHTPDLDFTLDASAVEAVHKVLGEAI